MKISLPSIFKNFYFLVSVGFILWVLFLDSNDLITQSMRRERLQKLKQDKVYYEKKIKEISRDYQGLFNSEEALEKFAREKYYLAKPKEDVFVIVVDSTQKNK
jgi:cell division protein FtsB